LKAIIWGLVDKQVSKSGLAHNKIRKTVLTLKEAFLSKMKELRTVAIIARK
jgi:hypothetical protein